MKRRKSDAHRAEMTARRERQAERGGRTGEVPPRWFRPKPETTNAAKVKAAHEKRVRRGLRRLTEAAAGGWRA